MTLVLRWQPGPTPSGRSTMLVGPLDENTVAAILTPGTRHLNDDGEIVSTDRWRIAYWFGMVDDGIAIDPQAPAYSSDYRLADLLEVLWNDELAGAREHLLWVRERFDERTTSLAAGPHPRFGSLAPEAAEKHRRRLQELLREAGEVIPSHAEQVADTPLSIEWF